MWSRWLRKLSYWRWLADYFPMQLVKTSELDPRKNYVFGYHPHGIISLGAFTCFGTEARDFSKLFPGINVRVLTLTTNFFMPLFRDLLLNLGFCSVTRRSCENILSSGPGNSILIVPGGAAESLYAFPGVYDLVLKKRLGFIKVAVRHGASLVPVIAFGENGRGVFQYSYGILPHRRHLTVCVGEPIEVEKLENPTSEQLLSYQKKYLDGLENLFNKQKELYAPNRKGELTFCDHDFPTHSVLTMPALSPTMTQGALGTWHKKIGDEIVPGDVLVEIETDKAQMDFECQEEGFLAKIFIEGGTKDVPVNKPIGILCESKDDVAAFESFTLDNLSPAEGSKESESSKKNEGQKKEQPSPKEKETLSKDSVTKEDSEGDNVEVGKKGSVRIFASPAAKALAAEKGYEISAIKGTGPDGRIVKADVESYKPSSTPQKAKEAPTAKAPSAKAPAGVSYQDVPISNLRRVIAQRLSESKVRTLNIVVLLKSFKSPQFLTTI
ncbi:diacylglycerol O-acyltransferase 1 [Clydaea vesicula]|uniref:Diacylglycerol O-acyltransferase n=1 Tax=Clydaea vesicula TaxID=447962 RepID=A0AAD5XXB1_9FUNG|nr:diacylglycerol O-acyltransferase 1 [Clydaea vesicula]